MRDILTRAAWYGLLYLPRQISQSDCEISSNCGKMPFRKPELVEVIFGECKWKIFAS